VRRILLAALAALVVTGAAVADPLDPGQKLTPADQAIAKAAVLVQGDLGAAWKGGLSATPSSLKAPICPSLRPDFSKLTLTGHAESQFANGNGGLQITSDAEVWKTLRQAEAHMKALIVPSLPKCIKYSFLKTPGGSKLTLFPVKVRQLGKFADVSVGYRELVGYRIGKQTVPVIADFVFLRKGRTEIYVNVVAPSSADEQLTAFETRLARALVGRVRG
jgi:hypothetical protein